MIPLTPNTSFLEAQARTAADTRSIGAEFLRQVRRGPRATAVHDFRGRMSRLRLAAVALSLIPLLELEPADERVGVVLPPGQGGALVNLALALDGRTAVNLNHTTGAAQLARMGQLAGLRTVVSSRVYLERIGEPHLPGRVLLAEDLIPRLDKKRVLWNMLRVLALPPTWIDKGRAQQAFTIIFSSGTTGDPKGVQISHQQLLYNCDAVMAHLDLYPGRDVVVSPLPLFHSFGLIPGLWMGLLGGLTVAGQADPRDGKMLGELIQAAQGTILISTPTFVRGYMRRFTLVQLKTLRIAVVGAERCGAELKEEFKASFGTDLLEGYGCTELSPAVAVNTPQASRDGSVGRPLPGIEMMTMDPETEALLPPGKEGLLVARTPGRMLGYLDRPDLTEAAFVHGGYNTGDMGHVDADGYVFITGRLARFAKMAGEMVPLDNVEAAMQVWLASQYPEDAGQLAVAAVPSARRGERLVVLHTTLPCTPEQLLAGVDDLPALFKPRAADFYEVEAIPELGTGKRDLGGIKRLAEQVAAAEEKPGLLERLRGMGKGDDRS